MMKEEEFLPIETIIERYQKICFISKYKTAMRGWLLDILNCIERIGTQEFSLQDVYAFADELQMKHPHNHHVKEKIRQQLQILRDRGVIKFLGRAVYEKQF